MKDTRPVLVLRQTLLYLDAFLYSICFRTVTKPRLTDFINIMAGEKDTDMAKDVVIITTGMFD